MRCKQRGLPNGTLIALPVAQEDEHPPRPIVTLRGQRHPATDRQSMAECARGGLDPGDAGVGYMASQPRTVFVEVVEPYERKEASIGQCSVQSGASVALA